MRIRSRDIWRIVKTGREGALIGLISGYISYVLIHFFSPGTFTLFAASPPSLAEVVFQTVVPYKPQIFVMLFGTTAGWIIDITNTKWHYIRRIVGWVK